MTHISVIVQRITLNVSCMTISGGRTEQLDIFCCVTGFTSDFSLFHSYGTYSVPYHTFHGALQLYTVGMLKLNMRMIVFHSDMLNTDSETKIIFEVRLQQKQIKSFYN